VIIAVVAVLVSEIVGRQVAQRQRRP